MVGDVVVHAREIVAVGGVQCVTDGLHLICCRWPFLFMWSVSAPEASGFGSAAIVWIGCADRAAGFVRAAAGQRLEWARASSACTPWNMNPVRKERLISR